MTVNIFATGNALRFSPFTSRSGIEYLKKNDIQVTDNEDEANVILSAKIPRLLPSMLRQRHGKRYLIWTNEPRFSKSFSNKIKFPNLPPIHIFNIYNDFYLSNYNWIRPNMKLDSIYNADLSHPKAVALMQFRNNRHEWSFKCRGVELDLCYLRTQIALKGYDADLFDIYGKDWPAKIKKGQSRGEGWHQKKLNILKEYQFNLAFENTNWPYYCTEKIWDSIMGGCLPIYYGKGNRIYEDFPEDSFLDFAEIGEIQKLIEIIKSISEKEYIVRLNRCIEAFNEASFKRSTLDDPMPIYSLERTVSKIHEVAVASE